MSEVPLSGYHDRTSIDVGQILPVRTRGCELVLESQLPHKIVNLLFTITFRSLRFFELPAYADTGTGSVERPCFLSDHIKPPCTPTEAASE